MPSVLWRCWLGIRKSIWPAKEFCDGVLVWLSIWSKMQIVYIWSSWCLCIPKPRQSSSVALFKSRLDLPFWYRLTQIVLEKRSLTRCSSSSSTHTHTRLTALCPGLPGWAGTRKVNPVWISLKQETVSGSGISWAICKSASRSRQITTPAPHHSVFYRPDALPAAQPTASKHWRGKGGVVGAAAKVEMT